MSKKIYEEKNKKPNLQLNNDKKDKKKFEANYIYEEEFWKDCSGNKECSKESTENHTIQEIKSNV